MNTLFWLTLFLNASGCLYGIVSGAEHLFRRQSFGNVLVRFSLGGTLFTLLTGTYELNRLGFQQTALWITLLLWLMIIISVGSFALLNLGEHPSEKHLPALPKLLKKSRMPLESPSVYA